MLILYVVLFPSCGFDVVTFISPLEIVGGVLRLWEGFHVVTEVVFALDSSF